MGHIIDVEQADDPRLAAYIGLREAALRRGPDSGSFIAEGPLVIRRAVAAGCTPLSFLLTPRWTDELADVWSAAEAPVFRVSNRLAEAITGFHVHRGALAALRRPAHCPLDDLLTVDRLVVAEDLVDHANVGAIVRSAAGLGWDGLLITAGTADPLYRRAVKTSMGAVFDLPWARLPPGQPATPLLRAAGFLSIALSPQPGALTLDEVRRRYGHASPSPRRLALLCGSEGPGLSSETMAAADVIAGVPMARSVDSLNVAAAAAVACYILGPVGDPAV
ncbi:MAG: RNA methyltransferase [Propionibacteriaceae bacterium]|jgi:tRNA G18 (ribose-2'-O)-methylase SpoU|nr:RNA methyltransferase [Propionibacteriaceae bacterium]